MKCKEECEEYLFFVGHVERIRGAMGLVAHAVGKVRAGGGALFEPHRTQHDGVETLVVHSAKCEKTSSVEICVGSAARAISENSRRSFSNRQDCGAKPRGTPVTEEEGDGQQIERSDVRRHVGRVPCQTWHMEGWHRAGGTVPVPMARGRWHGAGSSTGGVARGV